MKKLLSIFMVLFIIVSCSNEDLLKENEPTQIKIEDLSQLREMVLPPKFDKTPVNPMHITGKNLKYEADGVTLMPPPPPPPSIVLFDTVYYAGEGKINMVFVSDGFQDFELEAFDSLTQVIVDKFQETNGLFDFLHTEHGCSAGAGSNCTTHSVWEDFNFYRYRTASVESGVSVLPNDIRDTYWNAYRDPSGLGRLLLIPDDDKDDLEDDLLKNPNGHLKGEKSVFPVIIVNDGTYSGAGSFMDVESGNNKMAMSMIAPETEFGDFMYLLFVHETIGHAFSDQDDEYFPDQEYLDYAEAEGSPYFDYPERQNITLDTVNDQRWITTTHGFPTGNVYLEGGRYVEFGAWRSIDVGFMRSLTGDFSPHNAVLINRAVDKYRDD